VQCAECARLICTVHDEVIPVRYSGKYAANTDNVCTACAEMLYERGDFQMNRSGYLTIHCHNVSILPILRIRKETLGDFGESLG